MRGSDGRVCRAVWNVIKVVVREAGSQLLVVVMVLLVLVVLQVVVTVGVRKAGDVVE